MSAGGTRAIQPKRYRKRCEQQIGMSIQDNFAPLLRDCAQLMGAEENTDKRMVRAPLTSAPLFAVHSFVILWWTTSLSFCRQPHKTSRHVGGGTGR